MQEEEANVQSLLDTLEAGITNFIKETKKQSFE